MPLASTNHDISKKSAITHRRLRVNLSLLWVMADFLLIS